MTLTFVKTRISSGFAFSAILLLGLLVSSAFARQQGASEATGTDAGASASSTAKSVGKKSQKTANSPAKGKTAAHAAKTTPARTSTARRSYRRSSRTRKSARARGQQKIDTERATSIQQALIREHYLSGEPTGVWNQESEEAMRRYQSDHGWQTKEVPDSRALIKLGLGPSNDHLLNPESAMTAPSQLRSESPAPAASSASPASNSASPAASPSPPSATPGAAPEQSGTPGQTSAPQ